MLSKEYVVGFLFPLPPAFEINIDVFLGMASAKTVLLTHFHENYSYVTSFWWERLVFPMTLFLVTAKRIQESLGIQTSSSFDRSVFLNLKPIPDFFFAYIYGLIFYLETIGGVS